MDYYDKLDYYDILGVAPTASIAEIKSAYRLLAKTTHPDVSGDAARFEKLLEAYNVVSNPLRRGAYDRQRSVYEPGPRQAATTAANSRAQAGSGRGAPTATKARTEPVVSDTSHLDVPMKWPAWAVHATTQGWLVFALVFGVLYVGSLGRAFGVLPAVAGGHLFGSFPCASSRLVALCATPLAWVLYGFVCTVPAFVGRLVWLRRCGNGVSITKGEVGRFIIVVAVVGLLGGPVGIPLLIVALALAGALWVVLSARRQAPLRT